MSLIKIIHNGRTIRIPVRTTGFFSRLYGLMFRSRNTSNLLFEFRKDCKVTFTSLFVFFPYLSLWLDKNNRVLAFRIVPPFRTTVMAPCAFRRLVEVPVNEQNKEILRLFRRGRGNV